MITWKLPGQSRITIPAHAKPCWPWPSASAMYMASAWIWTRSAPAWQILPAGLWKNTQSRSNGGAVLTLILLTIIIAVIVIAILKTPRGPAGRRVPPTQAAAAGRTYSFSADRFTGRAVPGVLPRRPLRAVDLVIPAHAPAAALVGLAPVPDLAAPVRVPAAALAECPAGSVPAAAVPGRVAVPGAAAGSAPRAVGAAASVPAAVPPAAAVPGADNPFSR